MAVLVSKNDSIELQQGLDRSSSQEDGVEASHTGTRQDDVDMARLGRKQQLDVRLEMKAKIGDEKTLTECNRSATSGLSRHSA